MVVSIALANGGVMYVPVDTDGGIARCPVCGAPPLRVWRWDYLLAGVPRQDPVYPPTSKKIRWIQRYRQWRDIVVAVERAEPGFLSRELENAIIEIWGIGESPKPPPANGGEKKPVKNLLAAQESWRQSLPPPNTVGVCASHFRFVSVDPPPPPDVVVSDDGGVLVRQTGRVLAAFPAGQWAGFSVDGQYYQPASNDGAESSVEQSVVYDPQPLEEYSTEGYYPN